MCCMKIRVVYVFLSKIYKTPFPYHLVVWIYSQKLLNNESILFKYGSDPERAGDKTWDPGWFSQFLAAAPSTSPCRPAPCPCPEMSCWPGRGSSPCIALGPEPDGYTEVLCRTSARMLCSVGFRQYEKFPKSQSVKNSVRGHKYGNGHGNCLTSWEKINC